MQRAGDALAHTRVLLVSGHSRTSVVAPVFRPSAEKQKEAATI